MKINDNFEKLPESYLFSEVARRLREYRSANPAANIIRMDIGDVTLPVPECVVMAMRSAVDEMGDASTFRGYGPEQGYSFLRDAIAEWDYKKRGIDIDADDIFISDGAKSDLGNLGDIYSEDSIVAVADPGYPVYVDATVMSGRGGELKDGRWSRIIYLECGPDNGFRPLPPETHADVVILCSPSNPTGACLTREDLRSWVDYALRNRSIIIYDSAYEAYVEDPDVPRSIYEIKDAKKVAIEVRSFSKTAGFTGLRCGYTVVPAELTGYDEEGKEVSLKKLWNRRQTTKFNGVSYIVQRGAEALFTEEGQEAIRKNVAYYLNNARILRESMLESGYEVTGGTNSPYVWIRKEGENDSWKLFDTLLYEADVSCTPGVGFGRNGSGYIRLTGFNSLENTIVAMGRVRKLFK